MTMKTKIDLHSHTKGSDGAGTPAAIALAAKRAGLRGLALTDHHTNMTDEVHLVADALRNVGVLPIIGVEYSTAQGHLLIYGLDVPRMAWGMYPDMQEVIDEANALGGACIAPHPFKGYQRALHSDLLRITGLAAVGVLNGQVEVADPRTNAKALAAARSMGIPCTGASDAHFPDMIGLTYTEFDGEITSEASLVEALHSGKFRACRDEVLFQEKLARRHTWQSSSSRLIPRTWDAEYPCYFADAADIDTPTASTTTKKKRSRK
jgi:predicted metal-dependent phosphoesterase TrpH